MALVQHDGERGAGPRDAIERRSKIDEVGLGPSPEKLGPRLQAGAKAQALGDRMQKEFRQTSPCPEASSFKMLKDCGIYLGKLIPVPANRSASGLAQQESTVGLHHVCCCNASAIV